MKRQYQFIKQHPLGRRAPATALLNLIDWQIRSRLTARPLRRPWIGDAVLMVKHGMTGATGNLYVGLHEFDDMGFLLHFLRPGDLFADVGANIGSYSVLAGRVCGADVVGFEPDPTTAASYAANIAANDLGGRTVIHVSAVGDAVGTIRFSRDLDTVNHVVTADDADSATQQVAITTLDVALAGRAPALIKIDVEGHEPAVIAGATAVLADPALQAMILESADDATLRTFAEHGFVQASYDPFTRTLRPDDRPVTGNTLFVRDIAAVARRVADGPAFVALGQRV